MNRKLAISLVFLASYCHAQINLVVNPSLENFNTCPFYWDQITYSDGWTQLDSTWNPTVTSHYPYGIPEYCNVCAGTNTYAGFSNNVFFNHAPRTGNAAVEVQTFFNEFDPSYQNKRDYLQGHLTSTLTAGQSYCVTFYVTLEQWSYWATNNLGVYFDNGSIDTTHDFGLPQTGYTPQIIETAIINDTLNWVKVSGSFIANGTERLFTIGNFSDYAHTSFAPAFGRDTTGSYLSSSYTTYLLDDVSVIRSNARPIAGTDHTIPVGGTDSVIIGDILDTYLPVYWYVNGVKIDSNKANIKVKPNITTTYVVGLSLCGTMVYDTVIVHVGSTIISSTASPIMDPHIYPNPATNQITIEQADNATFSITDMLGRVVQRGKLNSNTEQIDLSALVPASYIVQLTNPVTGEKVVKKVVKE